MPAPRSSGESGILPILRAGDARIARLLSALAATTLTRNRPASRERVVRSLCQTLALQGIVEEEVLYPAMLKEHPKLVFALLLAGQGLSMRISEIRNPAKPPAERELAVLRLAGMVRRNLHERAQVLYRVIEQEISPSRSQSLALAYVQRSVEMRERSFANAADTIRSRGRPPAPRPVRRTQLAT